MNMAKGSIRILPKLKSRTAENGIQLCWLTAAGVLQGRHQLANVRGKRRNDRVMNFFLVRIPYIETLFVI
jgi:dGTP triphosphohydrolase